MTATMPKPHKDRGMEGRVARWYAASTGRSRHEFAALARRIAAMLPSGANVLEVAPGPGYFCLELARLGDFQITGLDISHTFVEMARKSASDAGLRADFQQGNAGHLPFDEAAFDLVLCRAAFKNFARPVDALREMRRVLKPGGRALVIDLRRDANPAEIGRHVDAMGLNAVNRLLTKLAFRTMLLKSAYTREQFEQMISQAGFAGADIREDGIGFEIWMERALQSAAL